jgi:hypothetical protein
VDEQQVALGGLLLGREQPGGRPDQALGPALGHLGDRPGHLEVVIVLRVDGTDRRRLPGEAQVVDDPASRLASVVPALEGGDDHR